MMTAPSSWAKCADGPIQLDRSLSGSDFANARAREARAHAATRRKSDGAGMLRDWWAAEDAKKFDAQAAKLAAQYDPMSFRNCRG